MIKTEAEEVVANKQRPIVLRGMALSEQNEDAALAPQDIDAILAGRTEKRQIGSAAGNTFSTATFAAEPAVTCPAEPVRAALLGN